MYMPLLPQVTIAHIQKIQSEEGSGETSEFYIRMLARVKTENPYYGELVAGMAQIAMKDFRESGGFSAKDVHELVHQVSLYCFRALELATSDAKKSDEMKAVIHTLMSDPDNTSLQSESNSALTETLLLFKQLGSNPPIKKRE